MFKFFDKATQFMPHAFSKEVVLTNGLPRILITPEAYKDMYQLVNLVDTEVGWVGSVGKVGCDFLIKEIFLLDQEVHSTTTEISPEGLSKFAMKMMSERSDGMDVVNSIRFWGHSHVRMSTSPSGQDDQQMRVFSQACEDFFIRGILNKNGRMEFTVYIFGIGVEIHDAEWSIYAPQEDEALESRWQVEIAKKVKKIVYPVSEFGLGTGFGKSFYPENFGGEKVGKNGKKAYR